MAPWRETVPADVAQVHGLLRKLAEYEKIEHEFVVTEADLSAALYGEQPKAQAMLAEVEGKAVGVCLWYRTFNSFAGKPGIWIEDVYVDPGYRNRGIARAAFRLLAARALDEGCTAVEWNVLDWNAPAISAYRAMGASARDGWTDQRVSGPALATLAGRG
ncbi:MAG: family N-acetyltransferase [Rubritepida sp.]|nr:family N-acetyltransferase [Rubritepida sp.]